MGAVTTSASDLRHRLAELEASTPRLRARDAAARLGVGEAQLLALDCGTTVTRLQAFRWGDVVGRLSALGRCMALTRNDHCVMEKDGVYQRFDDGDHAAQVVGPDIDLRLFFSRWAMGFAVVLELERGVQRSLQFFDRAGTAVHKVFLRGTHHVAAFDALVAAFRHADQGADQAVVTPDPVNRADRPNVPVDGDAFRRDWLAMTDTHEFFGLLRRYGLSRTEALRLAPTGMVEHVAPASGTKVLELAAADGEPLMIFVGNPGAIQIVTGSIGCVQRSHGFFNVLDEGFNLHLRDTAIAEAWVVRKPTSDGLVTSLELYDDLGTTIAMYFGVRKPGQEESPRWRARLQQITSPKGSAG